MHHCTTLVEDNTYCGKPSRATYRGWATDEMYPRCGKHDQTAYQDFMEAKGYQRVPNEIAPAPWLSA